MSWTTRIYTSPDRSTSNDTTFDTQQEAYAMLWTDPLPLPTDTPPTPTAIPTPHGFCMINDEGVCVHSDDPDYINTKL